MSNKETSQKTVVDLGSASKLFSSKSKVRIQLKLAKALSSTLDIAKRISLIAEEISKAFDVERCTIFLINEEKTHLIPQASVSEKMSALWKEAPIDLTSNSTTAQVAKSGKVVAIENATKVRGAYQKLVKRFHIKSSLYLPMKIKGETIGVMVIDDTKKNRLFSESEVGFALMLSSQAAAHLENSKLYDQINQERLNLESIQNSIPNGILTIDKDEKIVSINKAAKEFFKFKKNPIGQPQADVFFQNNNGYFDGWLEIFYDKEKIFRDVLAGQTQHGMSILHQKDKITHFDVSFSPQYEQNGTICSVIVTFRDSTQLFQQESKIKEQLHREEQEKERWAAVFNNVDEGILILDRNLKIKKVNPGFEILTGCHAEELLGKTCDKVNPAFDRKGERICETNCPIKKVEATKEPIPYFEHKIKTKYGKEIWVGSSYSPLIRADGTMQGTIHVMRDITKLKELDKAKSEFVSIASHELRTPLTVINGYLSLLLSGDLGKISPDQRVIFNKIYNDTQRLTNLVEDLLNVARIEEGRLKLNLEKTEPKRIIEEVVEELEIYAEDKKIDLIFNAGKNSNTLVLIDKNKIRQVLTNLLDNAIKYNSVGGKVTVKVCEKGKFVTVEIHDNGVGIPKHIIPTLFTKFQQVSGSYIKENKGTGLGLFIVKGLVELHGGEVTVDSTYGHGSTFRFTLPKAG